MIPKTMSSMTCFMLKIFRKLINQSKYRKKLARVLSKITKILIWMVTTRILAKLSI